MKLLPCPACGATNPKLVKDYHDCTSQVRCRECWVQTRWTSDAATLWNTRVVTAKIETSKEVVVATECDICGNKALYDAKTKSGPVRRVFKSME